jgi:hypothetical protein
MKFLVDESAEFRFVAGLRTWSHDVIAIAHDYPEGLADTQVLQIAVQERRILITNDSDFGDLIFRVRVPHVGVIFFRFKQEPAIDQKLAWLERILADNTVDHEHFIVVTERGPRVRRTTSA